MLKKRVKEFKSSYHSRDLFLYEFCRVLGWLMVSGVWGFGL